MRARRWAADCATRRSVRKWGQLYRQIRRDTRSRQRRGAVANETSCGPVAIQGNCPRGHEATARFGRGDRGAPMRSLGFISAPALTRAVTTSRPHEGAVTTRFRLLVALSHVSVRSTERGLSACVGRWAHIFGLVSCPPWWLRQSPGTCLNILTSRRQMPDACPNILPSRLLRTPTVANPRGARVCIHCHTC